MGHVAVSNCCKLLPFGSFQQFDCIETDLEIMGRFTLSCTCKSNIVCQLMKWHDCSDFVLKMEANSFLQFLKNNSTSSSACIPVSSRDVNGSVLLKQFHNVSQFKIYLWVDCVTSFS